MRKMNKLAKLSLLGVLSLFCVISATAFEDQRSIKYEVTPLLGADSPKIKITVTFKGDKSGKTKIKLPSEFGGQEALYKSISNLTLANPSATLENTDKPEIKIVNHSPNQEIRLEYELIQDWTGVPSAGGASENEGGGYRPILQKDYFHFLGNGAWIMPDLPEDVKLKVSIDWKDIPTNMVLANSFGVKEPKQNFSTTVESLNSSVFVGGDYQINQSTIKGKPIYLATRGKLKFTNDEFADLVQKTLTAEREFWNDYDHPRFLVTLLPIEGKPQSLSVGGTGLTDSFATFITINASLENIKFLISHEYFHNWNTIAFGGMKEPEQLVYWFSEGFTDYYAYRLLLRAGLIDLDKYVAQYNEFLSDYYLSPVRNVDNQRILKNFFDDYTVQKQPYRRGFLLATKWNDVIRQQSGGTKSLDDVMRNIFQDAKKGKFKKISDEYVVSVLSKYAKYDFAGDIEKYIQKGETINGFNGVLGDCVEASETNKGKFELGFDLNEARKEKAIGKVVENSNAYDAGLREGQQLGGINIYYNDPSMQAELTVNENGQPKKINYYPETKEKITLPQFKIKENLSETDKKACLDKLGLYK